MNLKQDFLFFYFVAALTCTTLGNEQMETPPVITDQPLEHTIFFTTAQELISIPCQANGKPPPKYTWKMNGANLSDHVLRDEGKLTIRNPTDNNIGKYQCFVSNDLGTAMSNSIFLRKVGKSDQVSTKMSATEENPFKLSCNFPKDWMQKEQYYWKRKQKDPENEVKDPRMTSDPKGNLWISKVEMSDRDTYIYSDPIQNSMCEIELDVTEGVPVNSEGDLTERYVSNKNESAIWNSTKKLYCIYDGNPSLSITWKMNDTKLNPSGRPNIKFGNFAKYLEIENFREEDQGKYSCEVHTTEDSITPPKKVNDFIVTIVEPYFTKEPQSMQEVANKSVNLSCEYAGETAVDIRWTYNGISINETTFYKDLLFNTADDCTIEIKNCTEKHIGNYGFNITNAFGYVYKDVYLLVTSEDLSRRESSTTENGKTFSIVPPNVDTTTTKMPPPPESTDSGNLFTIILVVVSILLSTIVVFLIIMKCKNDTTYGEYQMADREANVGASPEP